jgi:Sulfotransferase family
LPDQPKLPNFFIVGAPKAGTTSLYYHLDQHHAIYMSPLKEPNHFSVEVRPRNFAADMQPQVQREMLNLRQYLDGPMQQKRFSGMVSQWDDYCRLFAQARNETAIGEASVSYLWSRTAAKHIAARLPHAKIIIVLRNPIDRAFSQYLHNISDGVIAHSFRKHLHSALNRRNDEFSPVHPFLELGLYADQLQRFRDHFPPSQIRLWLYEDTASPTFFREVLDFLQVDHNFTPDTSKKHLEASIPKSIRATQSLRKSGLWNLLRSATPPSIRRHLHGLIYRKQGTLQLQQPEREILTNYYRTDILKLQTLLNRDLSSWLQTYP